MSSREALEKVIGTLTGVTSSDAHAGGATWTAPTLGLQGGHIFGGQMIAQAAVIGARLDPAMALKSVSVVFPRAVRDTGSLEYSASTVHKGSLYSTQHIQVAQPDKHGNPAVGFSAHVMCHQPGDGLEHSAALPPDAGSPEDGRPVDLGMIPCETRFVGATDLNDKAVQPARLQFWLRAPEGLGDDLVAHQALLAFATELTLIGTAILPHEGWSQTDAHVSLRTSVLAHAITFHQPFRADEWLLVSQHSPAASGGSSFGVGDVFTQDGRLVASFTQESMTRVAATPEGRY